MSGSDGLISISGTDTAFVFGWVEILCLRLMVVLYRLDSGHRSLMICLQDKKKGFVCFIFCLAKAS